MNTPAVIVSILVALLFATGVKCQDGQCSSNVVCWFTFDTLDQTNECTIVFQRSDDMLVTWTNITTLSVSGKVQGVFIDCVPPTCRPQYRVRSDNCDLVETNEPPVVVEGQ